MLLTNPANQAQEEANRRCILCGATLKDGSIKIKVARGDRRKDPLSLSRSRNFSLSPPSLYSISSSLSSFPAHPLICLLYLTGRWSARKGRRRRKKIFIYQGKFRVYPHYRTRIADHEKKG